MSCFVLLSQCMFKASPSTSTTERPTDNPNSTAFIHSTAWPQRKSCAHRSLPLCIFYGIYAFSLVHSIQNWFLSVQIAQSAHPKTLPS
ncbi:hypothetical protein ES319_A10G087800v1 [Gossypium barbadense]|uniref:Uncharacterized protein n=1 Tax=Gossypium barbadense TaxID=3634 RepID=A0A5J5U0F9_GOSBA|nr:hypothetical protein ES319_A10G087800v1 [Gossypium barbadense]